ncbi:MAG: ArsA family ATPase [Haloferacaceae archaeon]
MPAPRACASPGRAASTAGPEPAVVLYGGKGGVGKTTCAAAHALTHAERAPEDRTLVVSTDPAHSLGDVFDRDLSGGSTTVADGLVAAEVDPERGQDAYREVVEALVGEFRDAGLRLDDADLERLFEAGLVPGGDEVAALEYLARYAGDYDLLVLDTAPTGHALRLLDLPTVLGETLGVAGEVKRRVSRGARAARSVVFGPAAHWGASDDRDAVGPLRERVAAVGDLLRAPDRTRFRVVLAPERMAVAETERLLARLDEAGVPVGCLVVDRAFGNPDNCSCERCRRDADRRARRLDEVDARFDRPVRVVPESDGGVESPETLRAVGARLVG